MSSERGWARSRGRTRGFGRDGGNYNSGNSQSWRGGRNRDQPYGNTRGFRGGRFQNNSFSGRNQHRYNRPKRDTPGKRLAEEDIGVTAYISDHIGFNGIIKSRYSDFQVSEINEAGEVAKLTDLSAPEPPTEETVVEDEDLLLSKYNVEILPMETWDRINKLAVCVEATSERVEVDVTGMSKEHRTRIHDAVKKAFAEAIVGSTVTKDDKKFVCFEKYRKGIRIDNRVKWVWPGDYVHFIVHKENCDTMDAASKIAERLKLVNVKPSMLGYSGTKDRRAKTSQWFSLRRIEPKRVVNGCRDLREIHVGNFQFSSKHLKLGMLKGNRFRIALRNVTATEEVVRKACEDLRDLGFINYYGLQRFGTRIEMPTYEIGLKLLQGNFKEAINGILEEREGPFQEALQTYKQTGDAGEACKFLGKYSKSTALEGRLLTALSKDSRDLMQALDKVPRNTRLLYIHSYQSFVWNRCVSERIKRFGLKPAPGDLVLLNNEDICEDEEGQADDESDSEENQNGGQVEPEKKEPKQNQPKAKVPVKILEQNDVNSEKYSILDIVLPLPGYNIEYPPNMKEFYEQLLTKDGVTLEMRHKVKCYSMSGAYRHMVTRPATLDWSLVNYTDPYADLILSDLDELNQKELKGIVPDGKYKALLLTMDLPASCYATMALRELLRVDTSCDNQAQQNNYHKTDEGKGQSDTTLDGKSDTTLDGKSETEHSGEKRKLDDENEGDAKKLKQQNDE